MRIIISPAKKMHTDRDSLMWQDLPHFLPQAEQLRRQLCTMSYEALKKLWNCNDRIAQLNFERVQHMDLHNNLTPAILAYEGIQYQYMAPGVFTDRELAYVCAHLRILSGLYGILQPFDGVVPYRLEMQAKLKTQDASDLYTFWGDRLASHLCAQTSTVLNLASKEYSRCISSYLPKEVRFITCIFGTWKNGKVVEKGTLCKMARGEMVRYMAEHEICLPEDVQGFSRLGFHFHAAKSDETTYTFIKEN